MILLINTTKEKIIIALSDNGEVLYKKELILKIQQQTDKALFLIDKLLSEKKVTLKDLNGIVVSIGPGAFTSVRIGVVIANTLSYSLNIPVVGSKISSLKELAKKGKNLKKSMGSNMVQPFYGQEPNITIKRKN